MDYLYVLVFLVSVGWRIFRAIQGNNKSKGNNKSNVPPKRPISTSTSTTTSTSKSDLLERIEEAQRKVAAKSQPQPSLVRSRPADQTRQSRERKKNNPDVFVLDDNRQQASRQAQRPERRGRLQGLDPIEKMFEEFFSEDTTPNTSRSAPASQHSARSLEGRSLESRSLEGRSLESRSLEGRSLEGRSIESKSLERPSLSQQHDEDQRAHDRIEKAFPSYTAKSKANKGKKATQRKRTTVGKAVGTARETLEPSVLSSKTSTSLSFDSSTLLQAMMWREILDKPVSKRPPTPPHQR